MRDALFMPPWRKQVRQGQANASICQTSMMPGGTAGSSTALAAALPTASTLRGRRVVGLGGI